MLIQFLLICVLLSIGFSFSFSSSTCFRKSLMSSSHLFLNLPIVLFVFISWTQIWTQLSNLFQSSFTRSSCNSQCQLPFHFLEDPVQASNLCACHLVQCIYSASLYAIDPVFLFNRSWIHFLIWTVFKCHFPVPRHPDLRFRHRCYTLRWCQLFHSLLWVQYLVSHPFCIAFLSGQWVTTSCVVSIESFFRVLCSMSMFPLRNRQSEKLWRRKVVDDVWACSFLMSTLICICEERPSCRDPTLDFYCLWLIERDSMDHISRFHFLSIFRYSYHRLQCAFLCSSWWFWVPLSRILSWNFISFSVSVLWRLQIASRRRQISSLREHSFFLLSTLYFVLQRVLKHYVEQQPERRISLLISFLDVENVALFVCLCQSLLLSVHLPRETDVLVIDVARFECLPNIFGEIESNIFVKSTVVVHILIHHSWHFCSICTLHNGTLSDRIFWIQSDLLLLLDQVLDIIFRAKMSRTVYTTQVVSKSGSCSHSPRQSL